MFEEIHCLILGTGLQIELMLLLLTLYQLIWIAHLQLLATRDEVNSVNGEVRLENVCDTLLSLLRLLIRTLRSQL